MWTKPLPDIDPDNLPLFRSYARHEFGLFRCAECGDWYFPKSGCRNHDNAPYLENIEVAAASGRGRVFAYTVTHRAFHPGFEDDVPYTYALIELEEGPLFASQVIDIDPGDVEVELPVEVAFVDVPGSEIPEDARDGFVLDDGFTLPYFAPDPEATR